MPNKSRHRVNKNKFHDLEEHPKREGRGLVYDPHGHGIPDLLTSTGENLSGHPGGFVDKWIMKAGSTVVATNAGGTASVTFPARFPNGVITILVSNGDAGVGSFRPGITAWSTAGFSAYCELVSTTIRLNWIAIGY